MLRFRESKLETWVLRGSGDAIRSKLDAYLEGFCEESPLKAAGFGCMNEKTPPQQGFREVGGTWARTSDPQLVD